jgi:GDP-D-mannose dehydratase
LVGDASKARNQLNWKPVISFPDLVELMVQSDLKLLSKK